MNALVTGVTRFAGGRLVENLAVKNLILLLGNGKIQYHMVRSETLAEGFILASDKKEAIGEIFIIVREKCFLSVNCCI